MATNPGIIVVLGVVSAYLIALCIQRPRIGIAVCLLSFIPAPLFPTPEFGWLFYAFAGFNLTVLLGWLIRMGLGLFPFKPFTTRDTIGISVILWLSLCALGLPLSLVFNNGSLNDRVYYFAKGLVPFAYVLVFFAVRALPFDVLEAKRILNYVLLVAIAFSVMTYAIYAVTRARVISFYLPLAFPFIVLGVDVAYVRMLVGRSRLAVFAWGLLTGVLTVAILLNFTKAQVIVLVLSLGLMSFMVSRRAEYRGVVGRTLVLVSTFIVFAISLAVVFSGEDQTGFTELVQARLNDDSSGQTRLAEISEAFKHFLQSPVVGKGIGFQMERDVMGESLTSGYVHNQTAYTAMTMGSAGLLLLGLLVASWIAFLFRFRDVPQDAVAVLATLHGCVFCLVVYAEMFATFRTIQHNLLLGILLALIVRLTPKRNSVTVTNFPSVPIPSTS